MKKIITVVLCLISVFMVVGCGKKSDENYVAPNSKEAQEKSTKKSNCTVFECLKKIKPESTVEQINKIIGFEGKLTNEKYNEYTWEFSNTESLTATYYSSDKATIDTKYNRDSLKNKKVDLTKYSEIQSALKSGSSLTYDEFKSKVGGVDGTLTYMSSSSNKYIWVNKNGEYLIGTFSNTNNKCTFIII